MHAELAERLWLPSYEAVLREEADEELELRLLLEQAVVQHGSSYAVQQQRGGEAARARQAERVARAAGGVVAQARRLGNQLDIPVSVAARSLSWLIGGCPKRV
jgi:triphosphoribosyl-dephospho-CoA synthetase